jgi:hypothetical protein
MRLVVPIVMLAAATLAAATLAAAPATPDPAWRYHAVLAKSGDTLDVTADLGAAAASGKLGVGGGAMPFVKGLTRSGGTIRYTFDLKGAAAKLDAKDSVWIRDGVYHTDPTAWLVRPEGAEERTPPPELRVRIEAAGAPPPRSTTAAGARPAGDTVPFATGFLAATSGDANDFSIAADHLDSLPPTIFGTLRSHVVTAAGGEVQLVIPQTVRYDAGDAPLVAWVTRAVRAVEAYVGRLPVPHVLIDLRQSDDPRGTGRAIGYGGGTVIIARRRDVDDDELRKDWVLTHELMHFALPAVPREQHWLEEGWATYAEPLGRVRTGELKAEPIFHDMVASMPQGQPEKGDRGLDHTHTWGRTYWGGALFWLVADVQLREATGGRVGVDDAMRGIMAAGGSLAEDWPMAKVIETGDAATGHTVLRTLYDQWKATPVTVDLASLWRRLGVVQEGPGIRFDAQAPLAAVRESMISPLEQKKK